MAQGPPGWAKALRDGPRRPGMAQGPPGWLKAPRDGPRRSGMAQGAPGWLKAPRQIGTRRQDRSVSRQGNFFAVR